MPIKPENLVRHELIGLDVKIVKSSDPTLVGVEGQVINETKNTLVIRKRDGREIRVEKKNCVFHFTLPDGSVVEVDGKVIQGRPEDRIKKRFPRKIWGGLNG